MNREVLILFLALGGVGLMMFVLIAFFEPPTNPFADEQDMGETSASRDPASGDRPDGADRLDRAERRDRADSSSGSDSHSKTDE